MAIKHLRYRSFEPTWFVTVFRYNRGESTALMGRNDLPSFRLQETDDPTTAIGALKLKFEVCGIRSSNYELRVEQHYQSRAFIGRGSIYNSEFLNDDMTVLPYNEIQLARRTSRKPSWSLI